MYFHIWRWLWWWCSLCPSIKTFNPCQHYCFVWQYNGPGTWPRLCHCGVPSRVQGNWHLGAWVGISACAEEPRIGNSVRIDTRDWVWDQSHCCGETQLCYQQWRIQRCNYGETRDLNINIIDNGQSSQLSGDHILDTHLVWQLLKLTVGSHKARLLLFRL